MDRHINSKPIHQVLDGSGLMVIKKCGGDADKWRMKIIIERKESGRYRWQNEDIIWEKKRGKGEETATFNSK